MRPSRMAIASAQGRSVSAVQTRPPVSNRSAGASAGPPAAATPRNSAAVDTSIGLIITRPIIVDEGTAERIALTRTVVAPSKVHESNDSAAGGAPGSGARLTGGIGRCPEEARGEGNGVP